MLGIVKYVEFENVEDKLNRLKELGLVSTKSTDIKEYVYKGFYTDKDVECEIVGYTEVKDKKEKVKFTGVVILIEDKILTIHPTYLAEMQKKGYSK